ncbi:MAG TPA: hypothetical protein VHA73_01700 [Acidimicrobiales bacterium]|nr:hypothetical protein [Acidimicrobiales bacterium]
MTTTLRRRGRLGALAVLALLAASLLVVAPAFADDGPGGSGSSGDPFTSIDNLPIAPISCPASLKPAGALLAFCIEMTFEGGHAKFGSVSSTVSGPIKVRQVVAVTFGSDGLEITNVDEGGSGSGGGGLGFPPIDVPGGIVGNESLNSLLKPVTGVSAEIQPLGALTLSDVNSTGVLGLILGTQTEPFTLATASIPLRVKVNNLLLGDTCYIGSATDPITFNLPINLSEPQYWSGTNDTGHFLYIVPKADATDGSFAVPAAGDCGLLGLGKALDSMNLQQLNLFDQLLDNAVGLPAAPGTNLLSLQGYFGLTATGSDGISSPPAP